MTATAAAGFANGVGGFGSTTIGSGAAYGLAILGSSTGAQNQMPGIRQASSGDFYGNPDHGPLSVAYQLTRCSLPVLANYAVAGSDISEQEGQWVSLRDLRPSRPWFFVASNDIYEGGTAAAVWAWLKPKLEESIAWGGEPTVVIPFARTTTTAAQARQFLEYERLVLTWVARTGPRTHVCNSLRRVATPGSATLAPKTGYIEPAGTHLTNKGAFAIAKFEVSPLLSAFAPPRPRQLPTIGFETDEAISEKLSNPRFDGVSGSNPTSWTVSTSSGAPTIVKSLVARPEGHNALRVEVTASAAGESIQIRQSGAVARVPLGSSAISGCTVKIVSGATMRSMDHIVYTAAAATARANSKAGDSAARKSYDHADGETLELCTDPFVRVAAATDQDWTLYAAAYAAGTFILEIEAPYLRVLE